MSVILNIKATPTIKMAGKFTRFSEKRDTTGSDVSSYDDVIEGVEPEESAGLHIPISENNVGFLLMQKMGWTSGVGLGINEQGRKDPVPLELKDDNMGLGRFQMELDMAAEATEKRRQLEIEKELTPNLIDKYKAQVAKEHAIAESTIDLRKSYRCELCDKQYSKYSEYDNHLNSYDHHHRQRLKDLRQYETSRRFKGHRSTEELHEKKKSTRMVARERAEMRAMRYYQRLEGGKTPSFKPIGTGRSSSASPTVSDSSTVAIATALRKRSSQEIAESEKKIAEKKARLAKYGVKFQSAGHLATIGSNKPSSLSSYQSSLLNSVSDQGPVSMTTSSTITTNDLYSGKFVSSGSRENAMEENDKERDERLSKLPQASGRKADQLAAVEAATQEDEDSDEDFTLKKRTSLSGSSTGRQVSRGGSSGAGPAKQMTLKLTDRYESYYY